MRTTLSNINKEETESLLQQLSEMGYRFTRPLSTRTCYSDDTPPEKLLKAIILDTETTGFNQDTDKIIELGMVAFEFSPKTGQAYRVLGTFNQLEDPEFPIPAESTKVHHITDEMVKGKSINNVEVASFIEAIPLIIAHNAKFDRPFVESRFPIFKEKAWACSLSQIPWKEEGYGSASQEFLAYRFGFHYEGHRVSTDCRALLEILQKQFPESDTKVLKKLIESLTKKEIKVTPLASPYESKDLLRIRGYRWNPELKSWSAMIPFETLENEAEWLKSMVYNGRSFKLEQEKITAKNRFSTRKGEVEIVHY